jgi:hypothetical protein
MRPRRMSTSTCRVETFWKSETCALKSFTRPGTRPTGSASTWKDVFLPAIPCSSAAPGVRTSPEVMRASNTSNYRRAVHAARQHAGFPAHDYRGNQSSTIGKEKTSNPRLAGHTRDEYIHIMNDLRLALPDKIQESLQANQSAIDDDSVAFPGLAQLEAIRHVAAPELKARIESGNPPLVLDVP